MANNRNVDANASVEKQPWKDIQIPNRVAAIIIIFMVVAAGLVFFLRKNSNKPATSVSAPQTQLAQEASPDAGEVDVLPHTLRSFEGPDIKNPFESESLGDVRITGIVSNSNGKSTAIIEAGSVSYVVSTGDFIPESSWSVSEVTSGSVVFSNGNIQKTVYLQSQNNEAEVK